MTTVAHSPTRSTNTRQYLGHLRVFVGWLVGTYLTTMLLWVLVPTLVLGWQPLVVVSGSMSPLIRAGDVVLVDPIEELVGAGTVVAFESGPDEVTVHRVVDVDETGVYVTKGDANPRVDSTPVPHDKLLGEGRLLVPYIGLAKVLGWGWWVGLGVLALAAVPAWRARTGLAAGVAIGLLAVGGAVGALAVFTATTPASAAITAVEVDPPSNLTASCGAIGLGTVEVNLMWAASSTPGVTGYRILYDEPGGGTNWAEVGTVPSSDLVFTYGVEPALLGLGNHTFAVQALLGPWASQFSNPDAVNITRILVYICV